MNAPYQPKARSPTAVTKKAALGAALTVLCLLGTGWSPPAATAYERDLPCPQTPDPLEEFGIDYDYAEPGFLPDVRVPTIVDPEAVIGRALGEPVVVEVDENGCVRTKVPITGFNPQSPIGGLLEPDADYDGMGDQWYDHWNEQVGEAWRLSNDVDQDGLSNVDEFRWELIPACTPVIQNCQDFEKEPSSGVGGDAWRDGPEVAYWNDPFNDDEVTGLGLDGVPQAPYDPDRLHDYDSDGLVDTRDIDADNDGLLDGDEARVYGTYPELVDSDCAPNAETCTFSMETTSHRDPRQGQPGSGDGIRDGPERNAWVTLLGANGPLLDADGDGIRNILDPDSDADQLLDGAEFLLGHGQVRPDRADTENDGVRDGDEVAWSEDTDLDGFVNANDHDSDNDGMPDAWEVTHHFNMVDRSDAVLDRDGDLLTNLGEYLAGTDPMDMDSEDDLVLDGPEVNDYQTDPLWWDTDGDAMPDRFETDHGLAPTNPGDAGLDLDSDAFDVDNDGSLEQPWTNLQEYQYGRAADHDESSQGPHLLGTHPRNPDTDADTGPDGYEVFYGQDPRIPADLGSDDDEDGLTFGDEVIHGSDPDDPDTDGDGLCDGGRAAACTFPDPRFAGAAFQPGEDTYGTTPWETDSDDDGLMDWQEALRWDPDASGNAQDADADGLNGLIDRDSDNDRLSDGSEVDGYQTLPEIADTDADGLSDGEEILHHLTNPLVQDSDDDLLTDLEEVEPRLRRATDPNNPDHDGDGLRDGIEVKTVGTDPTLEDTDSDAMLDGWESTMGTQPTVPDADVDLEGDGLVNGREYALQTDPKNPDSDGDLMPDGYEADHALGPASPSGGDDADADGLSNLDEYLQGTEPRQADTDGDGLTDGGEFHIYKTKPLTGDTDADGVEDGRERDYWAVSPLAWNTNYDGDAFVNGLVDADSDNDGLDDGYEFDDLETYPHDLDTDDDGLVDAYEVNDPQGRFDPKLQDTDGDGLRDSQDLALECGDCDSDRDGLLNEPEVMTYDTDPFQRDSDCDGAPDQGELAYWRANGGWNVAGVNRLLTADVDGDSILDGLELGTVGTPREVLFNSDPAKTDTDDDGLLDQEEGQNNVEVTCEDSLPEQGQEASASTLALPAPAPPTGIALPGPRFQDVANNQYLQDLLPQGLRFRDPSGLVYALDGEGWYVVGAFGVRLYAKLEEAAGGFDPADVKQFFQFQAPGTNGYATDPSQPDTDGDGLTDNEESKGTRNPYKGASTGATNPTACDSDKDGLGDGLELDVGPYERPPKGKSEEACNQRDAPPSGLPFSINAVTNPNVIDTDEDGATDGWEDPKPNGWTDLSFDGYKLSSAFSKTVEGRTALETGGADLDTDDDGIPDAVERTSSLSDVLIWDSDNDGLSDGLETGQESPVMPPIGSPPQVVGTNTIFYVYPHIGWKTWQPWQGTTDPLTGTDMVTAVNDADSDGDGIIDGLEDLNRNGRFGFSDANELSPLEVDMDHDGLADGLELQIWGTPGSSPGNGPYTFPQAILGYGVGMGITSFQHLQEKLAWDVANPLQTNPRSDNTDAVPGFDDGVLDGLDVNPTGDAMMLLNFGTFQMLEAPDIEQGCEPVWGCENDPWKPDVKINLGITIPSGLGFTAKTTELDLPNVKNGIDLGSWLEGRSFLDGTPFSGSGLGPLAWQGGQITADLFDAVSSFPQASACPDAVCLKIWFREIDAGSDDNVDLHPDEGITYYGERAPMDLPLPFRPNPCELAPIPFEMRGDGGTDGGAENGLLALPYDIAIFQSFLEQARIHNAAPNGVLKGDPTNVPGKLAGGCP